MSNNFKQQVSAKTDQELIDIYINSDEYQDDFVNTATTEIKNRNISIEQYRHEKEQKQNIRITQEGNGVQGDPLYMTLGFIAAFMGGAIGIVAGYVYGFSKKDGRYYYNEKTRKQGKIMLLIGVFVILAFFAWRLDKN